MKTQPGYMKLGRLGDAVRKRTEPLVITPRLDEWLAQHDGITLDEKNAELLKTLTTTQPRDRSKSFSSSSRGKCKRFQVFQYLGAPKQQKFNTTLTNLFNDGTWRHLRWQMMLLSANILTDVEVPFNRPELRVRGSLDGINWLENWGFELKGTNQWGYSGVAKDGPMHDHLLQIHTYFLGIPELDKFALVYESKNTNEWNEIIVHKDPNVMTAVENEIDELNTAVDDRKLPPMIPECRSGTSKTFKDCPYSKICAGVNYEDTEALAHQEKHDAANNYQPIKLRRIKSQPVRRIKRARSETVSSRGGITATRRVAKRSR